MRSHRNTARWSVGFLLLFTLWETPAAKVSLKVIGGTGLPWGQITDRSIALDDTTVPGALPPH